MTHIYVLLVNRPLIVFNGSSGFKVDLVKTKDRLLDITAVLTCGVVNGRRIRVRPVIKPPWAEKLPDNQSEIRDEDHVLSESGAEPNSRLSKEQLQALRSQQGWPRFKDVFMLSSLDREDAETLKVHVRVFFTPVCSDIKSSCQETDGLFSFRSLHVQYNISDHMGRTTDSSIVSYRASEVIIV